MRVLVTGSREYAHEWLVDGILDAIECKAASASEHLWIVAGEARGADRIAKEWAVVHGNVNSRVHYVGYPADWDEHGKAAGSIRNQQMIDAGATVVVAFKNGFDHTLSRGGTEDCVRRAQKAGIPTYLIEKLN